MRYTKLALLFAIAMTPWLAHTRTRREIFGPKTEAQRRAQAKADTSNKVNAASRTRQTKLISISDGRGDTSKVMFAGQELMVSLNESRLARRKHIQDPNFGSYYTNAYINSRKNITEDDFIKKMAEVYFCLKQNGIQPNSSTFPLREATKNTTFEFLRDADSVNPRKEKTDLAMQMVLTLVANNKITPHGEIGMPLHDSLSSSRASALIAMYEKYNIAY